MTDANVVLVFLWIGVTVYAVLAGADFGGGVWDLLAAPTEVGQAQRRRIAASIGPVWEANHVWLIFALVVAWTGFPTVFAAIASTLYIPLTVVAFGIIGRGAAFAFRKASRRLSTKWAYGALFAVASLVTPFFLGMIAGAIASGRVPQGIAQGDVVHAWTGPTSFVGGTVAVAGCAFLSATFLAVDARRDGQDDIAEAFRRRALWTGGVVALLTVVAGVVLHADAPRLAAGLGGRALPVVVVSAMLSLTTLVMLRYRLLAAVRVTGALAVLGILWAWAAAQYPDLLPGALTVSQAAAPHPTLAALIIALVVGSLVLLPALGLLFWVIRRPVAATA
ncbi:MAG TPA: cytochrome d ubiquinol oxidase subunit II [Candidatus Dormibacteraeota bacterium]|nr:cytochrome d ubiquinol oxidase subunit II [Candidatus Dormibacteraeota bacterium]